MDDLEIAKQRLKNKELNLVFIKNSELVFETKKEGLAGFLQAIEECNGALAATSVADKVIGKAAAFLCIYSKVKAAFAITLSQGGREILNTGNIYIEFENLTPTILNLKKTDQCPFEKLVENITEPETAYKEIKRFCHS
jgi:hypothetical protein